MTAVPLDWVSTSLTREPVRSVTLTTIENTASPSQPLVSQRHQALALKAALEFQPLLESSPPASPIPPVRSEALQDPLKPLPSPPEHGQPVARSTAAGSLNPTWIDSDALRLNMTQALNYYRKKAEQLG